MASDLPFEFPHRWTEIGGRLFPNATPEQLQAVDFLEMNMRDLEDFLAILGIAGGGGGDFNNWVPFGTAEVSSSSSAFIPIGDTPPYYTGGIHWPVAVPSEGFTINFTTTVAGSFYKPWFGLLFYPAGTTEYILGDPDWDPNVMWWFPPDFAPGPSGLKGLIMQGSDGATPDATLRVMSLDIALGTAHDAADSVDVQGTHDWEVSYVGGTMTVIQDGVEVFVTSALTLPTNVIPALAANWFQYFSITGTVTFSSPGGTSF